MMVLDRLIEMGLTDSTAAYARGISPRVCLRRGLLIALLGALLSACGGGGGGSDDGGGPGGGNGGGGSTLLLEPLAAQAQDGAVRLSGPRMLEGTSYNIYWSTTPGAGRNGTRMSGVDFPFLHANLSNGTRYYYSYAQETGGEEGALSSEISVMPQVDPPGAPRKLSAVADNGRLTLLWDAPANAAGVLNYNVYWNTTGNVTEADARLTTAGSPALHRDLTNGVTYYYRVSAVNAGGESPLSAELVGAPRLPPLTAPARAQVTAGDGQTTLSWSAVPQATSYTVYWNTSGNVSRADNRIEGLSSPYVHTGLGNGTRVYYRLSAVHEGGESALTDTLSAVPRASVPDTPANVSAQAGVEEATFQWDAVSGADTYNLYWSTGGTQMVQANVQAPFLFSGLNGGEPVRYQVTAIRQGVESDRSAEAAVTPLDPPPVAPANPSATAGDAQNVLQWDAVPGAVSYKLYWNTTGSVSTGDTAIEQIDTPYVHTGLNNGTSYFYVVTALNDDGESLVSSEVTATPQQALPLAPQRVAASAGDGQVALTWDAAQGADRYTVYWGTDAQTAPNNALADVTTVPTAASPYIHNGLNNGTTYYYRVVGVNSTGEGPNLAAVSATPQASAGTPDPAPTGLSATAGDAQVSLSWNAVAGATSYQLYWDTSPGVTTSANRIDNATAPYAQTGLTNGTTYYYVVTATTANGETPVSAEVSAQPVAPVPANQAPVIAEGASIGVTMDEDANPTAFSLTLNASDTDNDTLTWRVATQAAQGTAAVSGTGTSKAISYAPNANVNGSDMFTVQVSDGNGGTDSIQVNVTINARNDAPQVSALSNQTHTAGNAITPINVSATDPDGDTLSYSATGLPNGVSINAGSGQISGTLAADAASGSPYSVTVTVNDGSGAPNATGNAGFTWTVNAVPNQAPQITEGSSVNVTMDEDGSPTAFNLTLNATDANNDTLTWGIGTPAAQGTAAASGAGASKAISYTPNANANGTDSFTVQVSDGNGGNDSIQVNVTINARNDAPQVSALSNQTHTAGNAITPIDVSATDPDGDTLSYSASGLPNGVSINTGTGQISGTVAADADSGSPYSVTVTVNDGSGASNATASTGFTWTVNAVPNQAPIIAEGASTSVSMSQNGNPTPFALTLNASDADNDTLTWSIATPAANGTASASGTGASKAIGYTPNTNYSGSDSFVVQVSDGTAVDTITVNVTVDPVNNAPVIQGGSGDRSEYVGDHIAFPVRAADSDGDTVVFRMSGQPQGVSIDAQTGFVSGTLSTGAPANSPYTVTLTADDQRGLSNSTASRTFTWTVSPPIQPVLGDRQSVISGIFAHDMKIARDGRVLLARGRSNILVSALGSSNSSFSGLVRDTSFGDTDPNGFNGPRTGSVTLAGDPVAGFALGTDVNGRVIVAGYIENPNAGGDRDLAVWAFTADGRPDTTFGANGMARISNANEETAYALTFDSANNILLAGHSKTSINSDVVVWRLTPRGAPDTSFAQGNAFVRYSTANTYEFARAMALDASGRIYVAGFANRSDSSAAIEYSGSSGDDGFVMRFAPSGSGYVLDTSFGLANNKTGIVFFRDVIPALASNQVDQALDLVIDGNNLFVAGFAELGQRRDAMAWKLFANTGELDTSFATGGYIQHETPEVFSGTSNDIAFAIQLDAQKNILLAGACGKPTSNSIGPDALLVRFTPQGVLDTSFGDETSSGSGVRKGYSCKQTQVGSRYTPVFYRALVIDAANRIIGFGNNGHRYR